MKTLILNDTRSERHLGCELVMQNLLRQAEQCGLRVISSVPNSATNDEWVVQQRTADYDLLLINGEGTLHHDQPKAQSLCRAATAAARQGKKVVLLNTVWQANDKLNLHLSSFDLIFCRESRSQAAIRAAGGDGVVVPDLIFATEPGPAPDKSRRSGRGTLVIDSVHREATLHWAWRAAFRGHGFATMHDCNLKLLRRRPWLPWSIRAVSGWPVATLAMDWPDRFLHYRRVISGRFHGCCLAMLLGVPVLGIASNTHKTEGLFDDVGLGELALLRDERPAQIERQFEQVASRADLVSKYVASARSRIAAMFQQIQSLGRPTAVQPPQTPRPLWAGQAAGAQPTRRRA